LNVVATFQQLGELPNGKTFSGQAQYAGCPNGYIVIATHIRRTKPYPYPKSITTGLHKEPVPDTA
jgi:hypothetical protein